MVVTHLLEDGVSDQTVDTRDEDSLALLGLRDGNRACPNRGRGHCALAIDGGVRGALAGGSAALGLSLRLSFSLHLLLLDLI